MPLAAIAAAALAALTPPTSQMESRSAAGLALPPAPGRIYTVRWQRPLVPAGLLEWRPQELGGPAADPVGGAVVVGTRDGWLHAFDPDGGRLWSFEAGGRFDAPPRIDGGVVYAGSSDGRLYAIELSTGKLRWRYDAQEEVGTTPVVGGGLVVVMTLQDTLVAVDATTGLWKWHHRREVREGFTIRGAASAVLSGGLAIGAYSDGTVAALDVLTGALKWERKVAPTGDFMDVDGLRARSGRLYAAAYSGAIYALDAQTGNTVWEAKIPHPSRVALGNGVLVAITTTQVLGVALQDGAVRWTLPLDGVPAGDPVVLGSITAVPNTKGLLLVETATGRLLRVFNPGTGVSAPVGPHGGRIYVLSNAGDLLALDLS